MTENNAQLLILTLNVNGPNALIKSKRIAIWVKQGDTSCLHLAYKRHISLREKKDLDSKDGKRFSKQMDSQNRQE
jgi:hypothetical protein